MPMPIPDPAQTAAATLRLVLDEHPTPLTVEEIRARIAHPDGDPETERQAVDEAVRDLIAHGVAHRTAGLVLASQAARYTARLLAR